MSQLLNILVTFQLWNNVNYCPLKMLPVLSYVELHIFCWMCRSKVTGNASCIACSRYHLIHAWLYILQLTF